MWAWHFQMLKYRKWGVLVDNIDEYHYKPDRENTLKFSKNGQIKYFYHILNSMNAFLLLVVM